MSITAKVVADSISPNSERITTLEIEYPRFILAELNTHRMLSKNSASSRAIPIERMHENIKRDPGKPIHWSKNIPGMTAKEELEGTELLSVQELWELAQQYAINTSSNMAKYGLHKAVANRINEPFQTMKTVISGTEWTNFFWLRKHSDAQPEFQQLATCMYEAMYNSTPMELNYEEWHVPYVERVRDSLNEDRMVYLDSNGDTLTTQEALEVSASCCAQVSYRKLDDTLEKARDIFKRLIHSEPKHASPVEHQAKPIAQIISPYEPESWKKAGVTHMTADLALWSGNFKGWIQHRQLIPGQSR